MGSVISRNVPPYILVSGHMAKPVGVNIEGLRRHAFTAQQIKSIKQAYKLTYRLSLKITQASSAIQALEQVNSELSLYTTFLDQQQGGIIR